MRLFAIAALVLLAMPIGSIAATDAETQQAAALAQAHHRFSDAIKRSFALIEADPFYKDPDNRAAGTAYVASMIIRTLEEDVVQDADFPFFRVLDPRIREGGDNADQRYLIARLRGGEKYRVWGRLGNQRRLALQIWAGDPWLQNGGHVVSSLDMEDIRFDRDGHFEVIIAPEKLPGNWMRTDADATRLFVRQIFSNWSEETPGEVHIDRIGFEGALKPAPTASAMADKLNRAADNLLQVVQTWPAFVRAQYIGAMAPNTVVPIPNLLALGGAKGRWMAKGNFDLQEDEALIVTNWPSSARYQGIQLTDAWFSSLEYANRQSSLTTDQSQLSSDGAYHFVISARDPGVANWLDTTGLRRGVILLRYDGMREVEVPKDKWPTAKKVKLADLRAHLPADTPLVSAEQRRAAIAERRHHVQVRFGN